ncbi:unnamed protein product [Schistosoma rodhaini]|uniref:Uncharacterized protein n=1 Tax=Schistosoma rodhaini TaxID=6188 RepID=A0A183QPY0_9TREM|nr:unnamed protein product [Schistosoma rodhaini]
MDLSRSSLLFILSLFIHIGYVKSQSNCTLNNLFDCCNIEGKKQADNFLQNQPTGLNTQQVVNYFTDLCKFRTLNEQASFIKAQYEKLSTADLTTMFTTKPTQGPTTTTPRTTQKPTIYTTRTTQKPTIYTTRTTQKPTTYTTRTTAKPITILPRTTEKPTVQSTKPILKPLMNTTQAP